MFVVKKIHCKKFQISWLKNYWKIMQFLLLKNSLYTNFIVKNIVIRQQYGAKMVKLIKKKQISSLPHETF